MTATPTGADAMKEADLMRMVFALRSAVRADCGAGGNGETFNRAVDAEEALLAAIRKLVEAQPAAVAGEAAPVTLEPLPGCHCEACDPIQPTRVESGELVWPTNLRMIVCAICGNKRCPHATDHRLTCTSSNEPGQPGSSYGPSKAVFVLRGYAAPAAPLVGEPELEPTGRALGNETTWRFAPAAVPAATEWLRLKAPEQFAAWVAGNASPSTVDWIAGWEACRRIAQPNPFHRSGHSSSEASGSAIPARPTLPTDAMIEAAMLAFTRDGYACNRDGISHALELALALHPSSVQAVDGDEPAPYKTLYYELLYAVGQKFPGETRHQTALRYIHERETASSASTGAAMKDKGHED